MSKKLHIQLADGRYFQCEGNSGDFERTYNLKYSEVKSKEESPEKDEEVEAEVEVDQQLHIEGVEISDKEWMKMSKKDPITGKYNIEADQARLIRRQEREHAPAVHIWP